MSHNRNEIVEEARKWLETPWVHQGRSAAGVDCAGLIIKVAEAIGHPAPDMKGYFRRPDGAKFLKHLRSNLVLGDYDNPKPGSIGVFRQNQFPCHVAIFSIKHDRLSIIHSHATRRRVLEEVFDHEWPIQLMQVLEFHEVEN